MNNNLLITLCKFTFKEFEVHEKSSSLWEKCQRSKKSDYVCFRTVNAFINVVAILDGLRLRSFFECLSLPLNRIIQYNTLMSIMVHLSSHRIIILWKCFKTVIWGHFNNVLIIWVEFKKNFQNITPPNFFKNKIFKNVIHNILNFYSIQYYHNIVPLYFKYLLIEFVWIKW